jgi:hypothetical protein
VNGSHYRLADGTMAVRVSTITALLRKPSLEAWRGRVGNEAADEAMRHGAAFGTRLHEALYAFAADPAAGGWAARLAPDLEPFAEAFLAWWWANVRTVYGAERFVIHQALGYAGTTDLVAELADGTLAVADWKSGKGWPRNQPQPDPAWRLQTAAYAAAFQAETGLAVTRRLVVHLPRDQYGALFTHEFPPAHQERDFVIFRSLLAQYRWQQQLAG